MNTSNKINMFFDLSIDCAELTLLLQGLRVLRKNRLEEWKGELSDRPLKNLSNRLNNIVSNRKGYTKTIDQLVEEARDE